MDLHRYCDVQLLFSRRAAEWESPVVQQLFNLLSKFSVQYLPIKITLFSGRRKWFGRKLSRIYIINSDDKQKEKNGQQSWNFFSTHFVGT